MIQFKLKQTVLLLSPTQMSLIEDKISAMQLNSFNVTNADILQTY
jgi:hypothetical protein